MIIHCWSGPRCVSTSLMYSFAQRDDTEVYDEPLYANYLQISGAERPYKDKVMESQEVDGNKFLQEIYGQNKVDQKVYYLKHMAKQKLGIHRKNILHGKHLILVREPLSVVSSFSQVLQPTLEETCYTVLYELLCDLSMNGEPPLVILSEDLVQNPEGILRKVCEYVGLEFQQRMLSWEAGQKPYDGVWASWWYKNTHKSTGFSNKIREEDDKQQNQIELTQPMKLLMEKCRPIYHLIKQHAAKPYTNQTLNVQNSISSPKKNTGTHVYNPDDRNSNILIGMRDGVSGDFELVWRPEAKVSVFDSGFILGDGVWEGIRLHKGVLLYVQEHIDRLFEGAKAIDMDIGMSKQQLIELVYRTCDANGMQEASGIHIRLMVTRGLKPTPYQNPNTTIGQPTIVIIPEWKFPKVAAQGLKLFTVHVRRGAPDVQDPKLNSHSKLNCILGCIQSNQAGADEGVMLDPHGFVATCNSVNFFIVRKGEVWTSTTKYIMPGITRQNVLNLCKENQIPHKELDYSLMQVYGADEAFVTGTFAGIIPVGSVDGRQIGETVPGPITTNLTQLYDDAKNAVADKGRQFFQVT